MTYQELMDRAYGQSTKNQPGEIAEEDTELLELAHRIFQALYSIGHIIAPSFYAAETEQTHNGNGGWDQPDEADVIFLLQDPDGEEVVVAPFDEKDVAPDSPSVYAIGQTFKPTTSSDPDPQPPGDNLTIYHTVAPAEPADKTDDIPAEYPGNHIDLPILQVALYLTRKDLGGRQGEYQVLAGERDKELARYVGMLENHLPTMQSRFSSPKRVADRSLVSFRELLTGAIEGGGGA